MSPTTKVQSSSGAVGSTHVLESSEKPPTKSLLTPFDPPEAAQARSFLKGSTLHGGYGPFGGGLGVPNIPRNPGHPSFPLGPNPFPYLHTQPYYPYPGPIQRWPSPAPIPLWPSPYFPNPNFRPCFPSEVPDYYRRDRSLFCYNRRYL
ncbi:MAG: hypothetical protein H7Z43_15600 [Clostridia bacterium]|nr:hypothetical protein [Deltaproteobacteria bacterium]